jgi:hypothetical protein
VDTDKDEAEFFRMITKLCFLGLGTFSSFMDEEVLNIFKLNMITDDPDIQKLYGNLKGLKIKEN